MFLTTNLSLTFLYTRSHWLVVLKYIELTRNLFCVRFNFFLFTECKWNSNNSTYCNKIMICLVLVKLPFLRDCLFLRWSYQPCREGEDSGCCRIYFPARPLTQSVMVSLKPDSWGKDEIGMGEKLAAVLQPKHCDQWCWVQQVTSSWWGSSGITSGINAI